MSGKKSCVERVFLFMGILLCSCFAALFWNGGVLDGSAASAKKTVSAERAATNRFRYADNSGRTLEKRGSKWYLKDKNGEPLSGICYVNLTRKGAQTFAKGFYYFEADGSLCTKQTFHRVKRKMSKHNFNGLYYFGGKNGKLYTKKGWITVGKKQYYLNDTGKCYTDRWKDGYYLQANGAVAKKKQVPDGNWVDVDGKKCAEQEVRLSGLKKKLRSTTQRYRGSWSVYVKDLKTGDELTLNNQSMYAASVIKAFVMASMYDQIKSGRLSENATNQRLLRAMITVSDNESYNELVRRQGGGRFVAGAATVNRYLKKNGYTGTACHSTLHPSASAVLSDGGRNQVSVKDCGLLLERIYNGTCVSKAYSQKMLNLLKQQQRKWKIPAGLPRGIKSANKTGETSTTQHDIAIVYGKKTDYVICVCTSGCGEGSAITGIKTISRQVYDYLN